MTRSIAQDQDVPQPVASAASETTPTPVEPYTRRERPAHLVVLRLSAAVLQARMNRDVDRQIPVTDVVLGTPVRGVARLVGKLRVQPVPADDKARFRAVFAGTVHTRTVGRNGSVTVHGHSITNFSASKDVAFEPGKGFSATPTKITAQTQCFTDDINPGRGGLIGRIVERKAAERIAAERPTHVAISRQRAVSRITAGVDAFMDEQLKRFNEAVEFQTKLAQMRNQDGVRKLFARTTPEYVEIADAIFEGRAPVDTLVPPPLEHSGSPVEIWIHGSLVPEKIGQALKTIFKSSDPSAIVSALAALPGPMGKEAAAVITALKSDNKVTVQEAGEWMVVELNSPAVARMATTSTAARR